MSIHGRKTHSSKWPVGRSVRSRLVAGIKSPRSVYVLSLSYKCSTWRRAHTKTHIQGQQTCTSRGRRSTSFGRLLLNAHAKKMHGASARVIACTHTFRSTILLEDVHVRCITIIITMNLLATSGVSFSLHPSQCGCVHGCMALYVSLI